MQEASESPDRSGVTPGRAMRPRLGGLQKTGPAANLRVRQLPQAETANSVIMPVDRWAMWWQCSIQRAASPASTAIVTMAIGGTCTVSRTAPANRPLPTSTTWKGFVRRKLVEMEGVPE